MASTDNTLARTLHDIGLAAWFGGSLMGAAGVNGAAAVVENPTQRLRVPTPAGPAGPHSTWPALPRTWPAARS